MSGGHAHTSGVFTEIDHVGIAVRDLDAAVEWYGRMFGATVAHRERIEITEVHARSSLEVLVAELPDRYVFGVKSHGRWP